MQGSCENRAARRVPHSQAGAPAKDFSRSAKAGGSEGSLGQLIQTEGWGVVTVIQEETCKSGGTLGEAGEAGERRVFEIDRDALSRDVEVLCEV